MHYTISRQSVSDENTNNSLHTFIEAFLRFKQTIKYTTMSHLWNLLNIPYVITDALQAAFKVSIRVASCEKQGRHRVADALIT